MENQRTIAAVSTPQAPGGIGIVRISGSDARQVADLVFRSKSGKRIAELKGYRALFGAVYTGNGEKLDDVVALFFASPRSYTGEDVVELSCHGGLYVTKRLLQEVLAAGAVPAGPGEFTRRAFLNGKMDLTQAESVMQLIGASGEQAARAAEAASSGVLSRKIGRVRQALLGLSAHLAAWADFPEEEVPEVEEGELTGGLHKAEEELSDLLAGFDTGRAYREGLKTVIAGRPNAGKSTLMNLLSGCERSIVSEYAGTTRDVVEDTVLLGGVPLRLADTAGIRETEDPVESIGVAAAKERLKTAQLVLAVFDSSQELSSEDRELMDSLKGIPAVAVVNKTDLPAKLEDSVIRNNFRHVAYLSASSGEGLESLKKEVSEILDIEHFDPADGVLSTERQRQDANRALKAVKEALEALKLGLTYDAVTVCVEDAISALSSLIGERVSDEIIDQVFEEFCVGK